MSHPLPTEIEPVAASAEPDPAAQAERIQGICGRAIEEGASDIHIVSGERPWVRIAGDIRVIEDEEPFSADQVEAALTALAPGDVLGALDRAREVDFGLAGRGETRFRASAFRERRGASLALRVVAGRPPSLDELHLPRDLARVIYERGGLVLLAGHAGAGKTTTLASVLQEFANRRTARLLTLEDPIEYRLAHGKAYVEQRELGRHFDTFESGMRECLDAAPDAIAVGELRDCETMRLALQAAEAGILVFATVHAYDATRAIGRVVDAFAPEDRRAARVALGGTLRMIIAQTLLRARDGGGKRYPAIEVCRGSMALAALVRDGKEHELTSHIEAGHGHGMRTMDESIVQLVKSGFVSRDEALFFAVQKETVRRAIEA
jgi:twitching motility protein PilT